MESEETRTSTDASFPRPKPREKESGAPEGQLSNEDPEYITGMKLALVLASLTIMYFLVMLDNTILATAIPYITDDFHSLLDIGWYGSAYQLSSAALQPLTGKVYARLGVKWPFVICFAIFEVGSVLCGTAKSSIMLIVGRAVAGIGGSGLLNGGLIILNSSVPPHRQPALLGILMGIGQLGIAFGPLLGGAFTEYVTWRWCFYINLPIGAIVVAGTAFIHIPDDVQRPHWRTVLRNAVTEFDLMGFVLFAPAAIQFFLALQYGGNQFAWDSRQVIGLFCGAGATFVVWMVWDGYQGDSAMIPFSMVRKRVVWASCISALLISGTMFVTAYCLPLYFQAVLSASPFMSGVDVLPNILAQMIFGVLAGGMIQKVGYYTPFLLAGAILNAIGCGLTGLFSTSTSTGEWVGYQILFGAGRGLAMTAPILAMQYDLPKEQMPLAMTILVFIQNFASAVMIVISQTIFTNSLVKLVPKYAPSFDPSTVINAGSTAVRSVVPPDMVAGVLEAYAMSLDRIFYFCAGIAAPAFLFGWFLGWKDIRKKPDTNGPVQIEPASAV